MAAPESSPFSLCNHFLIAMPGVEDEPFVRSVVLVCEHSAQGALGLVINKPADLLMAELFERLNLPSLRPAIAKLPVVVGGPVHGERGFVLHEKLQPPAGVQGGSDDDSHPQAADRSLYASSLDIRGSNLELTTSSDVLQALAEGSGPARLLMGLGVSSWGEGQLEEELAANSWLTAPADLDILFEVPLHERYARALALLGLEAWRLSSEAGHA